METTREYDARYNDLSPDQKRAESRRRNTVATAQLRNSLKIGDRLRATKAVCGSREASFTFSHWEGGWIKSTGGADIAPGMVYSINGDVLRI